LAQSKPQSATILLPNLPYTNRITKTQNVNAYSAALRAIMKKEWWKKHYFFLWPY